MVSKVERSTGASSETSWNAVLYFPGHAEVSHNFIPLLGPAALPAVTPVADQLLITSAVTDWDRGVTGESPYGDSLQQESHVGSGCLPLNDDSRWGRIGVSRLWYVYERRESVFG